MDALKLTAIDGGFDLTLGDRLIIRHRTDAPPLFVGRGRSDITMFRGNFDIADRLDERIALRHATIDGKSVALAPIAGAPALLRMDIENDTLRLTATDAALNRFWLRVVADADEQLWGAGEQLSYFGLRGRRFPLWTSEPGVGRDKSSALTFQADAAGQGGGDYWNTNYPQPTWLSSRRYALHVETTAYSAFDFRDPAFHEIEAWEVPARIELFGADRFTDLVGQLSTRFGRPPRLPDWAFSGAILGLKDGERSFARMDAIIAAGATVTGLWCEDWVGLRVTSFGKRLFWNWTANDARYPQLRERIAELADRGIRFLGYVNPYLALDGTLYQEALAAGHLALRQDVDEPYLVDFGEFDCGIVDFTTPAAAEWFAERVIGREMLDIGLAGWMADFGEYLPTDVRLANGLDGMARPQCLADDLGRNQRARGRIARADRRSGLLHARGIHRRLTVLPAAVGGRPVGRLLAPRRDRHRDPGGAIVGLARQRLSSQRSGRLHQPFRQCPHARTDDALERTLRLFAGNAQP